ncbi:hypothetical protein PYW07_000060 [Mythimna separata]|uniref:Uncharacterized protein n=1 Tax=Mythimna separata TaxID=271217 RepID=A0AAD7Z2M4_MYTSE|nr:hypothetical protein PYW07_000060 [Mythimna separata]
MSEEYNEAVRRYRAMQQSRSNKPKMQIAFNPRRDHEALLDFMERAQELYGPIELKFVDRKEEERREASEWVLKKKRPQPREEQLPFQEIPSPQDKDSKASEVKKLKQQEEEPLEEAAGMTDLALDVD